MSVNKDDIGPELIIEVHRPDIGLDGYLVIDNTKFGPGKGGIRMHKDVSRNEVVQLARAMSLKNTLAELPFGGAKAGIVWNHTDDKAQLFDTFIEEIKCLMPSKYIAAPDIRTGELEMDRLVSLTGDPSSTTGKSIAQGGISFKTPATGFGVAVATQTAAKNIGLELDGARVIVDGYGVVGSWVAHYLQELKVKIIATSDRHGAVYNSDGLNLSQLDKLKASGKPVGEYTNSKQLTHDEMLHLPADILITASVSNIVNEDNFKDIKVRLIVEGSNLPMTYEVEERLHRQNITVVPDIVANSGGVIASYVENQEKDKSDENTKRIISEKISRMTKHVLEASKQRSEYPRASSLELAEERLRG